MWKKEGTTQWMYVQDLVTNCGIHTLAIYKMYNLGENF